MELSKAIASTALVLGVLLVAGHGFGQGVPVPMKTAQERLEEREAARRVAVEEQQKRKDAYERACNRPLKSDLDWDLCRTAYKRLQQDDK